MEINKGELKKALKQMHMHGYYMAVGALASNENENMEFKTVLDRKKMAHKEFMRVYLKLTRGEKQYEKIRTT